MARQAPPPPRGPVFSWRAFAAERAIAIMAYLGGFLALVATLTLVISRGENLPTLTLSIICLVYLAFGVAGLTLRRVERLRIVSRAYLAVFALMTPLVALALYRYQLQSLNVPVAGMLCISALYAMLVYLVLALQTRFITYAYLGWAALIVAAIAIIPWAGLDLQWWVFILGLTTLALLAPHHLRRSVALVALLAEPAIQMAALATVPVVLGVQVLGAVGLTQIVIVNAFSNLPVAPAPLALGACVLVPITAGWRLSVPSWRPRQQAAIIDTIDGFNAVFFAEAVGGVALWAGADNRAMAYVLAVLALVEFVLAVVLYRWQPQRRALRSFLEVFATGLASGGAFIVIGAPSPNWPLISTLSAALAVTIGAALIDSQWWLLVSGFFLTFDYYTLVATLLPADQLAANRATLAFALALALWAVALALGIQPRTRRFVAPVYLVAFGEALYTAALLPRHDAGYQTEILLVFTAAAFSAGLRERQPVYGNVVTGFFGVLAALPFVVNDANGLHAAALALGLALAALAARRFWGRIWMLAPYAVALWAVIVATIHASMGATSIPDWSASGLPFAAWLLLLFTILAYALALWEGQPLATLVPAALAFWALQLASGDLASVVLVFALIALGVAVRQWRGRGWGSAVQIAAAAGSVTVTLRLNSLGPLAPDWQETFLLTLAVAAYLVAAQEREPVLTIIAVVYALAGAMLLPGPDNLAPTLALTFVIAALGASLRLPRLSGHVRRAWALAPYATAAGCSILATLRVVPFDASTVEALLLVFAAVAYLLAVLERKPLATLVPLFYALAAILVQTDAHALLALALIFALLGLIAGRVARPRWFWTFYAAASIAAASTAIIGHSDSSFEALALLILAALAYLIALVESLPDVLIVALPLGLLALAAGTNALALPTWAGTLAFAALAWLYTAGAPLWNAIPWLRQRGTILWLNTSDPAQRARWSDPRLMGTRIHRAAGLLVGAGAALVAVFAPGGFSPQNPQTLAAGVALLSLAGLLALLAQRPRFHLAIYLAGELIALAITWVGRWLGADNVQWFVLAPGSYQLLVGAFLPADRRVRYALRIGQVASLTGALLLLLPTLYQAFTEPALSSQFIYGLAVLVEALLITGLGVGIHSRSLIFIGSAFVGIDTLSGVGLALRSGAPIPLVVGIVALLLMGAATWLALRARRDVT